MSPVFSVREIVIDGGTCKVLSDVNTEVEVAKVQDEIATRAIN